MSAFVVEDKTINVIVAALEYAGRGHSMTWPNAKYWDTLSVEPAELGKQLFDMNIAAVNARYGEGQASRFRPLDYQYKPLFKVAPIPAMKAIDCLLYQCTEGHIPETSQLYKDLSDYRIRLACIIVGNLPEYEAASWG